MEPDAVVVLHHFPLLGQNPIDNLKTRPIRDGGLEGLLDHLHRVHALDSVLSCCQCVAHDAFSFFSAEAKGLLPVRTCANLFASERSTWLTVDSLASNSLQLLGFPELSVCVDDHAVNWPSRCRSIRMYSGILISSLISLVRLFRRSAPACDIQGKASSDFQAP